NLPHRLCPALLPYLFPSPIPRKSLSLQSSRLKHNYYCAKLSRFEASMLKHSFVGQAVSTVPGWQGRCAERVGSSVPINGTLILGIPAPRPAVAACLRYCGPVRGCHGTCSRLACEAIVWAWSGEGTGG